MSYIASGFLSNGEDPKIDDETIEAAKLVAAMYSKVVGKTTTGQDIHEGDYIVATPINGKTFNGQVVFNVEYGMYGLRRMDSLPSNKLVGSSGSSTSYRPYTWKSYRRLVHHFSHM